MYQAKSGVLLDVPLCFWARGLEGNLAVGQIVEQVIHLGADEITNVVFMGMGEPLANYDTVTRAIRILNASWGLGIGARKNHRFYCGHASCN